jgi:hypothetical protein
VECRVSIEEDTGGALSASSQQRRHMNGVTCQRCWSSKHQRSYGTPQAICRFAKLAHDAAENPLEQHAVEAIRQIVERAPE